jgi:nucleotide-binding universal stress UspA family protein
MSEVVVGVDDSEGGRAALAWAHRYAKMRGLELHVIYGWDFFHESYNETIAYPKELMRLDAAKELESVVHDLQVDNADGLIIRAEVIEGKPAEVLIEASKHAELVVVGSRGRGGFAALLLGSTSQAVVQHAHCPVTVVRSMTPSSTVKPPNT